MSASSSLLKATMNQTSSARANPQSVSRVMMPDSPEAVVLGLEPVGERVDHAAARVVHGQGSVRHPLRRALHPSHGLNRINRPTHTHQISDTAVPNSQPARKHPIRLTARNRPSQPFIQIPSRASPTNRESISRKPYHSAF